MPSSNFISAEDQRDLHRYRGWKRHAAWAIFGIAFLLGTGAGGSVAVRSLGGQPIFTPHITSPAIGRATGGTSASPALAEISWSNRSTDDGSSFGGGPPVP
jgi:hypothetical protein